MTKNAQEFFIAPPKDAQLKKRLVLKLKEYKDRLVDINQPWRYEHPDLAHSHYASYRGSLYKAHILEIVLASEKPVSTWQLSCGLYTKWGQAFSVADFNNACAVISKYCGDVSSDEGPLTGGTGLPELPEKEEAPTP